MEEIKEVKPEYPDTSLREKTLGKNIFHAPQPVTAPPAAPNWATSGGSNTHLDASNTTELTAIYTTLNEIYNALLKEGLIKPK